MSIRMPLLLSRDQLAPEYRWRLVHSLFAQRRSLLQGSLALGGVLAVCLARTGWAGFATLMAKWAGAADPNGAKFNGSGWTKTMLDHLTPHIPQGEALPGDFAVFGHSPGTHVVVLVESGGANGNNPQVVSHGQQGDPISVRLSVEKAAHSGQPVTFLRLVAGDVPAPANPFTPLDILNALNADYKASHAFWTCLTAQDGKVPTPVLWPNLVATIEANPLTTTEYPANYP